MERNKEIKSVADPTIKDLVKPAADADEVITLLLELLRGHGHLFTKKEIQFMKDVREVKN
jgi:hypothetical protein